MKILEPLVQALGHFSHGEETAFLRGAWQAPARRGDFETSRQARHARFLRNRTSAVVATYALGAREPDLRALLLSPEFARLRPLSAQHHTKFIHFAVAHGTFTRAECERLWEFGAPELLEIGKRLRCLGPQEILVVNSILTALFLGPIFHGEAFAPAWQSLWKEARRRGLLDNLWLRMQLAMMGTHVGRCEHHVDYLMDERTQPRDMSDAFFFVRRDLSQDLLRREAANIRGDWNAPEDSLLESNPVSTLNHLASYIRACMRDVHHFYNEGHALMLLGYAEQISHWFRRMKDDRALEEDIGALLAGLRRIEKVQHLEKSRFFRIWERTPASPVRERLIRLWSHGYAGSNE